jgi:hypothetical protein
VADDEDRSRDSHSAAGAGSPNPEPVDVSWATATAPDDIRELAADVDAYHRERRAQRRRQRYGRLAGLRGATPLALTVAVLALLAIVTTLLTVMGPTTSGPGPTSMRLAAPQQPIGHPGGLLPDVTLRSTNGTAVESRALRPGVVLLLPARCDSCGSTVAQIDQAADDPEHLPLFVVAPTTSGSAAADSLDGQLRMADDVLYDAAGALRAGVGATAGAVAVVVVNRDGRIYDIKPAVTDAGDLSQELVTMLASPPSSG